MHANRFDNLSRELSTFDSRRRLLRLLAGSPLLGLLALWHEEETEAGRRRAHRRSHRDNDKDQKRIGKQEKRKRGKDKGKGKGGKRKDSSSCANAGQTPRKGKRCCQGLVKDGTGRCASPPPGPTSSGCAPTCSGCCAGATCITATTDAACGTGGAPCAPCTLPQTCGGGNAPGVCGCTPMTTCPAPLNCGSIDNGCATGTIDCGECIAPATCGGGTPSTPNVCGCTPTCPSNACGDEPDGCGGTISCSTCAGSTPICTGESTCVACSPANPCPAGALCRQDGSCLPCTVCASGCPFQSVQAAIGGSSETIYICPGIYQGTITIDKNLTLIGAGSGDGAGNTILHGGGSRPVVTIDLDDFANTGINVVLQSVRITGGFIADEVPTGNGGGISIRSHEALATLAMTDCVVFENTAGRGGGIFNSDGTLSLTDCEVLENEAAGDGGGIYTELGEVTLNDSHVTLNTANQGGGIYSDLGMVTLNGDSSVTENTAADGPNNCAGSSVTGCSG